MFNKLLKEKSDIKVGNIAKKALSDFMFFSRSNKNKLDEVINIANTLSEKNNFDSNENDINKLSNIIENASIADLIKYMKCDNEIVRSLASQSFADCESSNLFNCIELMLNDDSENLRSACMQTLYNLLDEKTIGLLKKGIEDESANVRLKAAICLSEIARIYDNKEALNILNNSINDPDPEVRELIIDELGLIGSDASISGLFNAIEDLNDDEKTMASESLEIILAKTMRS